MSTGPSSVPPVLLRSSSMTLSGSSALVVTLPPHLHHPWRGLERNTKAARSLRTVHVASNHPSPLTVPSGLLELPHWCVNTSPVRIPSITNAVTGPLALRCVARFTRSTLHRSPRRILTDGRSQPFLSLFFSFGCPVPSAKVVPREPCLPRGHASPHPRCDRRDMEQERFS